MDTSLTMSIAAATSMQAASLQQAVNVSVLKKAMNAETQQAAQLLQTLPEPGRLLDVTV